ncbi:MAG TPA: hypothetical protein VD902_11725 [Symbiobacteriaceae bacterium]|nr:hypothetical protein [Symbiobacteriaceae bacterium]
MILVVVEQLDLRFLLMHQGKFLRSAKTATEALRFLRSNPTNLQGVVLDERIPNGRLVSGYIRTHIPNITLVSWQMALRASPFSDVPREGGIMIPVRRPDEDTRYVWDRSQILQAK